jgi:hypothetical protein
VAALDDPPVPGWWHPAPAPALSHPVFQTAPQPLLRAPQ